MINTITANASNDFQSLTNNNMAKPNSLYLNGVQPAFPVFEPAINWKKPTSYQAAFSNTYLGVVTSAQKRIPHLPISSSVSKAKENLNLTKTKK